MIANDIGIALFPKRRAISDKVRYLNLPDQTMYPDLG